MGRWQAHPAPADWRGRFGYDPLMFIDASASHGGRTDAATKNQHSHRALRGAIARSVPRDLGPWLSFATMRTTPEGRMVDLERLAPWLSCFTCAPGTLSLPALPPLALYVHLPWCLKKPHCDFNSHEAAGPEPADTAKRYLRGAAPRPRSRAALHLGPARGQHLHRGGTPSLFDPEAIDRCSATSAPACRWSLVARSR